VASDQRQVVDVEGDQIAGWIVVGSDLPGDREAAAGSATPSATPGCGKPDE